MFHSLSCRFFYFSSNAQYANMNVILDAMKFMSCNECANGTVSWIHFSLTIREIKFSPYSHFNFLIELSSVKFKLSTTQFERFLAAIFICSHTFPRIKYFFQFFVPFLRAFGNLRSSLILSDSSMKRWKVWWERG